MIRNKIFYHTSTEVVELGFSDHFALVENIVFKRSTFSENIVKRSIDIFNCRLKSELWDDVYLQSDVLVNRAYSSFLNKLLKYFLHIFPQRQVSNKTDNQGGLLKV
jgi:hypothetical protein